MDTGLVSHSAAHTHARRVSDRVTAAAAQHYIARLLAARPSERASDVKAGSYLTPIYTQLNTSDHVNWTTGARARAPRPIDCQYLGC